MPKTNIKNKRHVAHLEQVARQDRAIKIGAAITIALVLGLAIYAIVIDPAIKPHRPVASVNGVWITVEQFQAEGKIQRLQLLSQYNQYLQYAQMFGVTRASVYNWLTGKSVPRSCYQAAMPKIIARLSKRK